MSAARGARPVTRGANRRGSRRRETAAVRWAVIGPPSRIAIGTPVAGSLRTTTALDRRQAERRCSSAKPVTHFMPDAGRRCRPRPRRAGGPASRGRTSPSGRGWTPIFGGSSAPAARRGHRQLGEREALRRAAASPRRRRPPTGSAAAAGRVRHRRGRVVARRRSLRSEPMAAIDVAQSLENLKLERDAIVLYDALAAIEKDPRRAAAFRTIAAQRAPPRRHLGDAAARARRRRSRRPARPRLRVRFIILARPRSSGRAPCRDLVQALEGDEEATYDAQGDRPEVEAIAADEREHAEIWQPARRRATARRPEAAVAGGAAAAASPRTPPAPRRRSRRASAGTGPAGRGRCGRSSSASATASCQQPVARHGRRRRVVGRAPLHPAGGHRRAPGRGVQHGRRRVHLDAEPARAVRAPDRARAGRAGGDARGGAGGARGRLPGEGLHRATRPSAIAHRMFADPETALDTLVREELGLDPDELGSPWGAAGGSFVAFAIGAVDPGPAVPVRRRRRRRSPSASASASSRCSRSGPASAS